jgi:hypothetical protein
MKILLSAVPGLVVAAAAALSAAAEEVTVKSLTAQRFTVVSSFMTEIGPGLFLQNGEKLYLCFVTERRETQVITTNYCKPVE